jgi:hypothetical protein
VLACLDTGQSLHRSGGLNILASTQPAAHTLFGIKLTQVARMALTKAYLVLVALLLD